MAKAPIASTSNQDRARRAQPPEAASPVRRTKEESADQAKIERPLRSSFVKASFAKPRLLDSVKSTPLAAGAVVIDESKLASDIVERVQLPQLELQKLRKLATDPDGFSGFVTSVFGDGIEGATIEDLRSMLVSEDFRWSPAVATNRSQRLPDQNGPSVAPFGE
ncbi:MAG: hypothetical protein AAFY15_16840, partial [Cyanobacteria bacterium J06648_11]